MTSRQAQKERWRDELDAYWKDSPQKSLNSEVWSEKCGTITANNYKIASAEHLLCRFFITANYIQEAKLLINQATLALYKWAMLFFDVLKLLSNVYFQ